MFQSGSGSSVSSSFKPLNVSGRMERLPVTRITWHIVFLAGFAWFIESLDIGVLGVALNPIKEVMHLTPSNVGLLTAASTFGIVLGLIPAGFLSDKYGRKRLLVFGIVEYSLLTLACAFSPNYQVLLLLRFLSGLGMGAVFPLPYAIVSEFVNSRQRTLFNGMMDAFLSVGYFIAPLLGMMILPHFNFSIGWRIFFVVSAAPLFYAFVIQRWLPESPRWLAKKGRTEQAERTLSQIERSIERLTQRQLPDPELERQTSAGTVPKVSVRTPWTRPFITRTISRSIAATGTFFMFYIVMTYMPTIFRSHGFSFAHSLIFTAIVTGAAIPGKILNGYFAERLGRKVVYVLFMGIAGIASLFFGLASTPSSMVLYACIMSFFGTGAFPALKMSYAEQYPTHVRTTGAATVETIGRLLGGVIGSYAMPIILSNGGLSDGTAVIAAVAFVALVFEVGFSKESKGATLEQLEVAMLQSK
ncbi:MFS transporter [Alicyclobacillus sp. SO9]|uniref:MFS transporter n=1 Tax=Alicyclobacillus sp. SO9 TaxID=2665646 RepID=UPI0018E7BE3D|nr:MFS transporter [Alicyclobacillus sp. SO9]QQE76877.1 MFS transporter [Alicyclobacillus sp. SO9]